MLLTGRKAGSDGVVAEVPSTSPPGWALSLTHTHPAMPLPWLISFKGFPWPE